MDLLIFDKLLLNWQIPTILLFLFFLYDYARRYGMGGYVGSIPPRYQPPSGLSLLQSGVIYDKFTDKADLGAAILELAQKGHLEIFSQNRDADPFVKKRQKETSDLTMDQRYLLDTILFPYSDLYTFEKGGGRKSEQLNEQLDTLNEMLYDWTVTEGYMHQNPSKLRDTFLSRSMMIALPLILLSTYVSFRLYDPFTVIKLMMGAIFIFLGLLIIVASLMKKNYRLALFGALWLLLSFFGLHSAAEDVNLLYTPVLMLPVLIVSIWYFHRKIGPFRQRGVDTFRDLLGYKAFMEKTEEEKIRYFLNQDPLFLDKGIPYAVLFGIAEHWLKYYKILDLAGPVWYHGEVESLSAFLEAVENQMIPPSSGS